MPQILGLESMLYFNCLLYFSFTLCFTLTAYFTLALLYALLYWNVNKIIKWKINKGKYKQMSAIQSDET